MTNTCYWNHEKLAKTQYTCMDGENVVCPYCCVEKCPVETPQWFAACAAAGHPTWPSQSASVPRELVCLEAYWNDEVFRTLSVKGFFDSLAPLITPPLKIAHRYVESAEHLDYYTRKPDGLLWTDQEARDVPIFYLAFHGSPGTVYSALDAIGPDKLCEAFRDYGEYDNLVYFGACSVFADAAGEKFAKKFLKASQTRAVIGYTTNVDWINSLVIDMLFLYRFYTDDDPWNNLADIFNSVLQDFAPAKPMGYTLIQA
ncbi:MAG TPA: hypothetical protein PKH77_14140 [Anaerolineae bacterium]|nr:hypothetical protein [Anaerolineae bacterium]